MPRALWLSIVPIHRGPLHNSLQFFFLWYLKVKVNLEWVLPPTVYSVCEEGNTGKLHGSGQVAGTLLGPRPNLFSPPILHPKKPEFLLTGQCVLEADGICGQERLARSPQ